MIKKIGKVEKIPKSKNSTEKDREDAKAREQDDFLNRLKRLQKSEEEKRFDEEQKKKVLKRYSLRISQEGMDLSDRFNGR